MTVYMRDIIELQHLIDHQGIIMCKALQELDDHEDAVQQANSIEIKEQERKAIIVGVAITAIFGAATLLTSGATAIGVGLVAKEAVLLCAGTTAAVSAIVGVPITGALYSGASVSLEPCLSLERQKRIKHKTQQIYYEILIRQDNQSLQSSKKYAKLEMEQLKVAHEALEAMLSPSDININHKFAGHTCA